MADVRRMRPQLGTFVEMTVRGLSARRLEEAVSGAFAVIQRMERRLSRFDPVSDVSALNRGAFHHPVRVGDWCYRVVKAACRLSSLTGGLFDCATDSCGRSRDIVFLPGRRIRFTRPLSIDLGGIAKGFAVDLAVRELKKSGVPSGCVNAGGDLRVFGRRPQPVYVRHPQSPRTLLFLGHFKETALATSGPYFGSKICAPKAGRYYRGTSSVTVTAPRCVIADALTKPVLLNPENSQNLLKRFRAGGFLIDDLPHNGPAIKMLS